MSLWSFNKEVRELWHEGKRVQAIWHEGRIIWEGIRSCFGSGYWRNDQPWDNDDAWRN
ncbi:MFS transporter [bacterium]|nr:MFS transporter [bacterium]